MFSHHPLEYIAAIASRQILQAQQELQVIIYFYIYRVFKNDGSKIRGVVGDAKISGKCQRN